jgi:hypothetical protein
MATKAKDKTGKFTRATAAAPPRSPAAPRSGAVSGSDIVAAIDAEDRKKQDARDLAALEAKEAAKKEVPLPAASSGAVRGQDVIKTLRQKGMKI